MLRLPTPVLGLVEVKFRTVTLFLMSAMLCCWEETETRGVLAGPLPTVVPLSWSVETGSAGRAAPSTGGAS